MMMQMLGIHCTFPLALEDVGGIAVAEVHVGG